MSSGKTSDALLSILESKYELVDAVNALDEQPERARDVVNKCIRDPVGRDRDVVAQLFDTAANILWMGSWTEVELQRMISTTLVGRREMSRRTESITSRKTMAYMFTGSRCVRLYGS